MRSGWAGTCPGSSSGVVVLAAPLVLCCRGRSSLPACLAKGRAAACWMELKGCLFRQGCCSGLCCSGLCMRLGLPSALGACWEGGSGAGVLWLHLWSPRAGSGNTSCPHPVQAGGVTWAGWPREVLIKSEMIPFYKSRGLSEQGAVARGARQPLSACRGRLLRALLPVWATAGVWDGGKGPRTPPAHAQFPRVLIPGQLSGLAEPCAAMQGDPSSMSASGQALVGKPRCPAPV